MSAKWRCGGRATGKGGGTSMDGGARTGEADRVREMSQKGFGFGASFKKIKKIKKTC